MISKFRESIFLKILLVFGVAAAANVLVLKSFQDHFMFDSLKRMHRGQNMAEYGRLLVAQIPERPSQEELAQIAQKMYMQVRIQSPDYIQTSSPDMPSFEEIENHLQLWSQDNLSKVGHYRDSLVVLLEMPEKQERVLMLLESTNDLDAHPGLIMVPIAGLLLILSVCYIAVRRILSPLTSIEAAVQEVGRGNLKVSVESRRSDELGRLAQSFNRMIEQVRTMISSKEQLLLDVSHEFRSPLTRIKVALEIPGGEAREAIDNALHELDTMLTELLESARLNDAQGRLRLEKVNLVEMLGELADLYEDRKPGLQVQLESPDCEMSLDPARMQIALRNILENAMKYSSDQDKPVEMSLARKDSHTVRVRIRDYGIGIPTEELPLIFEPFYRVDRSRLKSTGGYGLGLALSRKIVAVHRGQIFAESEPGRGSCFTIELPCES